MSEKKKKITILIAVAAAVIAGIILALFMMGNSRISAVIMRLIRLEGTVSLQDADGNLVSIIERMKLHSGNKMNTGQDSIEFFLEETQPEDLPIQALDAILRDPDLLEKVMEETGWTEDKIQEGLKENKNVDEKGAATEEMTPLQEENTDPISTP